MISTAAFEFPSCKKGLPSLRGFFLIGSQNEWGNFCVESNDVDQISQQSDGLKHRKEDMNAVLDQEFRPDIDAEKGAKIEQSYAWHQQANIQMLIGQDDIVQLFFRRPNGLGLTLLNQPQIGEEQEPNRQGEGAIKSIPAQRVA